MSSYYKTKETALRHIDKGENFRNKTFRHFWNDKEVFLAAVKKGFEAHKSNGIELERWGKTRDDAKRFPDWYEHWCWDGDYVSEIAFTKINTPPTRYLDIDWLAPFLPDSFTGSVEVLEQILSKQFVREEIFQYLSGEARAKYRERRENHPSTLTDTQRFNRILYERNTDLIRANRYVAAELVKSSVSYLPKSLLADRDFCFLLVKNHAAWSGVIVDHYRGDLDFVTDLYESGIDPGIHSLSYDIRKLVKREDPRTFLSAHRLRERLEAAAKTQSVERKAGSFKI